MNEKAYIAELQVRLTALETRIGTVSLAQPYGHVISHLLSEVNSLKRECMEMVASRLDALSNPKIALNHAAYSLVLGTIYFPKVRPHFEIYIVRRGRDGNVAIYEHPRGKWYRPEDVLWSELQSEV